MYKKLETEADQTSLIIQAQSREAHVHGNRKWGGKEEGRNVNFFSIPLNFWESL